MKEQTALKVMGDLKKSYLQISEEFNLSRNRNWPEFKFFSEYLQKNDTILDLGCGNGRLLNYLEGFFLGEKFDYLGIDFNQKILDFAVKNFPKHHFMEGDQQNIPAVDECFDIIFNIAAFHHLAGVENRLLALREMKRVIRKNGKIVLTVWNLWQKKYLQQHLAAIIKSILTLGDFASNDLLIPWKNQKSEVLSERYYHAFTLAEMNYLFQKAGLRVIESFGWENGEKTKVGKGYNFCYILQNVE